VHHSSLPRIQKKVVTPIVEFSKKFKQNNLKNFQSSSKTKDSSEFQYIEAEIIKTQLEVLKKFPEDSKRREYFEEKFTKDLKYCESRINSGNDSVEEKKREKVLKMHQEFLKLLRFFRFKWNLLNEDLGSKPKYDPKFTQVYVIE
jgi:tRNA nucleotidyltransferase/poly(A) polymerase